MVSVCCVCGRFVTWRMLTRSVTDGQCLLCLLQVCNMENVDPLCHRWSVFVVFAAGLQHGEC